MNSLSKTYTVQELFEDIPGDPDNVLLNIPHDICESQGWVPGDTLIINAVDGKITITKK